VIGQLGAAVTPHEDTAAFGINDGERVIFAPRFMNPKLLGPLNNDLLAALFIFIQRSIGHVDKALLTADYAEQENKEATQKHSHGNSFRMLVMVSRSESS
jgi:hypothetical protein